MPSAGWGGCHIPATIHRRFAIEAAHERRSCAVEYTVRAADPLGPGSSMPGVRRGNPADGASPNEHGELKMEATKTAGRIPVRSAHVAADFLRLAGASVVVGLLTSAAASAVVILLSAGS
jgi:hypothetical protein